MKTFECNACGDEYPQEFQVLGMDTGGDTICARCHVECCPEDADILRESLAAQKSWMEGKEI